MTTTHYSRHALQPLACAMGYERIEWDSANDCYSGWRTDSDLAEFVAFDGALSELFRQFHVDAPCTREIAMRNHSTIRVSDFAIVRHGADFVDHWQGQGIACTDYDHCVTGSSPYSEADALGDALDQCYEHEDLTERVKLTGETFDDETTARQIMEIDEDSDLDIEPEFRVSILYNVEDSEPDTDLGMHDGRRVWIDETRRVIAEMMTDSTGRSFLDSGSAYGRNWEHNQKLVETSGVSHPAELFEHAEPSIVNFRYGCIDQTHHLYHWLAERLEYNRDLDLAFDEFANDDMRSSDSWLENMTEFVNEHLPKCGLEPSGIYGDGDPVIDNSYNHETLLSQVIQYIYWEDDNGAHVLLQVHGGCDVRGGYTQPRAFDVTTEVGIFFASDGSVGCSECDNYWRTDDSCHYYHEGSCGGGAGTQLEDYERFESEGPSFLLDFDSWFAEALVKTDPNGETLFVDEDGTGHCPDCGSRLVASIY